MNYSGISKYATHPLLPSLAREGKPEGRGELKPQIIENTKRADWKFVY
jgi:hypothetical protein